MRALLLVGRLLVAVGRIRDFGGVVGLVGHGLLCHRLGSRGLIRDRSVLGDGGVLCHRLVRSRGCLVLSGSRSSRLTAGRASGGSRRGTARATATRLGVWLL